MKRPRPEFQGNRHPLPCPSDPPIPDPWFPARMRSAALRISIQGGNAPAFPHASRRARSLAFPLGFVFRKRTRDPLPVCPVHCPGPCHSSGHSDTHCHRQTRGTQGPCALPSSRVPAASGSFQGTLLFPTGPGLLTHPPPGLVRLLSPPSTQA